MKKLKSVILNKNIAWKRVEDEAVVLNLDTGFYYSLNPISTKIWELLDKKKGIEEIIREILCEYDVEEKILRKDLKKLIEDLKQENLIRVS
jgi:hypothetical protein